MSKKHNVIKDLKLLEISAVDRPAQVGARMTLLKRAVEEAEMSSQTAEINGTELNTVKGKEMTENINVEDLQKSIKELESKLASSEKINKMSDKAKAYMTKLDDKEKEAFLSLTSEEQEKKVQTVTKADETLEVSGQTIRKSEVGDGVFAVMKAQAAQMAAAEERIAKAENDAAMERLAKRADDEMAHLPGDRVFKARVLKAADSLSAEDQTAFAALVKSANDALKGAFEEHGVKKGKEVASSANAALDEVANEIAKRDSIPVHKAYERAIAERPELYDAIETPRA